MGMYDTVYVGEELAKELGIVCPKCKKTVEDCNFQTKSFWNACDDYLLQDVGGLVKLRKLFPPEEENNPHWEPYTEEEKEEMQKKSESDTLMAGLNGYWLSQGGAFTKEAFKPENRISRSMGELPHQWVEIHTSCEGCGGWIEYKLKFTDGVMVKAELVENEDSE